MERNARGDNLMLQGVEACDSGFFQKRFAEAARQARVVR